MILNKGEAKCVKFSVLIFLLLSQFSNAYCQNLNTNWKQEVAASLEQFVKCKETATDPGQCNNFTGESLNKIYKVNDFYMQKSGRYMAVNEIPGFIKTSDKWELLGHGYDQTVLKTAQESANAKKAVIAVYVNADGKGHTVVITPGDLHPSGSWGLNVPSAVSFFPTDPSKSFVDKGLSYAFAKSMLKDVLIYVRKY
jgi:hypothetical protein